MKDQDHIDGMGLAKERKIMEKIDNEQEMRIAIAEACGWRIESDGQSTFVYPPNEKGGNGYRVNDTRHPKIIALLPDYLNDLNAMHEAEKVLTDIQCIHYFTQIMHIHNARGGRGCSPFDYGHATAAQRAGAFCRTIYPERF